MILKEVYLYPDLTEYSDEIIHPFRDQSRSVCNFLERHLSAEKFETVGFKKICFVGTKHTMQEVYVNSSGALIVPVTMDEVAYKNCVTADELNEFFISLLLNGLATAIKHIALPVALFKDTLDEFRRNHFKNEWVFKSKKIKNPACTCVLECRLTIDFFLLSFKVVKSNTCVLDKEILRTAPDEVVFLPYLKDIKEENGRIKVIDKSGMAFYTTTAASFNKL